MLLALKLPTTGHRRIGFRRSAQGTGDPYGGLLREAALDPHEQAVALQQEDVARQTQCLLAKAGVRVAVEEEVGRPRDPDRVVAFDPQALDRGGLRGDLADVGGVEVAAELGDQRAPGAAVERSSSPPGASGRIATSSDRPGRPAAAARRRVAGGRPAASCSGRGRAAPCAGRAAAGRAARLSPRADGGTRARRRARRARLRARCRMPRATAGDGINGESASARRRLPPPRRGRAWWVLELRRGSAASARSRLAPPSLLSRSEGA